MKKIEIKNLFLAGALFGTATLVVVLLIFRLNTQRNGIGFSRGVGVIGIAAQQENAKENEKVYIDAGHDYVYEIRNGIVDAVVARAPSRYPFAFACGLFVKNGSSVNIPLRDGDILFQKYSRDDVYPTWNSVTGEYKEVTNLESIGIVVNRAVPVSLADLTGDSVMIEKESCVSMTAAASLLTIGSLIVFGVLSAGVVIKRFNNG